VSNKSVFRKFLKGTPAKTKPQPPRSTQEINAQYTELAKILGDKVVKIEGLEREKQEILKAIDNLGAELNERNKLDQAEAEKKNAEVRAETVKQADAGIPNGTAQA